MSEFVEVKTHDLSGAVLDWAVAKAEGVAVVTDPNSPSSRQMVEDAEAINGWYCFSPSNDWSQGGPLIEKYSVEFEWITDATIRAEVPACGSYGYGNKHLTAALRAVVSSVLGDTVSVPKELLS